MTLIRAMLLALVAGTASAQNTPTLLLSYEATPFGLLGLDGDGLAYDAREEVTEAALAREVPAIFEAMGVAPDTVETLVMPGGYLLNTNASLQSSVTLDDAAADRLAAALGFAFRQWSVLVTDFEPQGDGDTGYGIVAFEETLTGEAAHAFFLHAASVNEGLGGGYTAFDDEMIFLNVTDSRGDPYSGLPDEDFEAALREAAESYQAAPAQVTQTGRADARFIENDWEAHPNGEGYAETLGGPATATLAAIRATHEAALREAAPASAAD